MIPADRQIQLHRLARRTRCLVIGLLLLIALLDHVGLFGYSGDDWRRFDRRAVQVHRVIDDQTLDCGTATVRLLGVSSGAERATSYSEANLEGREVTLRLDVPQTRDAAGELLAYVYLSPSDCWNVDLIRDGSAYVDRASACSMLPVLVAAESARNKAIYAAAHKAHS
jgi:endonuclease YncB( thermonuclease family)